MVRVARKEKSPPSARVSQPKKRGLSMPFKVSPQTPQSLWKRGLSMLFILVASGVFPEFTGNMLTAESTQGQGNAQKPLSSKAIFSMNLKKTKTTTKKHLQQQMQIVYMQCFPSLPDKTKLACAFLIHPFEATCLPHSLSSTGTGQFCSAAS